MTVKKKKIEFGKVKSERHRVQPSACLTKQFDWVFKNLDSEPGKWINKVPRGAIHLLSCVKNNEETKAWFLKKCLEAHVRAMEHGAARASIPKNKPSDVANQLASEREKCAMLLDEMAETYKGDAADALREAAARIRGKPTEEKPEVPALGLNEVMAKFKESAQCDTKKSPKD